MGMTIHIKSSDDTDLDLHFESSNAEGDGKWGTLHIAICSMQWDAGQHIPRLCLQCELDHDDIDKLIRELQAAKGLLAGDEPTVSLSDWEKERMRELFATVDSTLRELFATVDSTYPAAPETVCSQCGYRADRHSYSGACIERLPDNMIRFSKTQGFRS